MRFLLLTLVLAACSGRDTRPAVSADSAVTSAALAPYQEVDSVLVYSGPLPTSDTVPAAPVPESQMESGVTYVNGFRINLGSFDSVARRLELPRVVPDADCAEDGCGFPWRRVACNELTVRAKDSDDAPVVGKIAAGDTFTVKSSHVHITPAKLRFRKDYAITDTYDMDGTQRPRPDTVRFAAGETLYVFEHDETLGTRWWYHGMLGRGSPFWDEGDELSPQHTVTWYEVARPDARSAWWKSKGSVLTSSASHCAS
jgi:hypothetical protein